MAVVDNVRGELRKDAVKLWLSPYTPPEDGALASLSKSIAVRLGADVDAVACAIEELRCHAVEKLRSKTRITLLGRVAGGAGATSEIRAEFYVTNLGSKVRAQLCSLLGRSISKVIAGGKSLQEQATLEEQGWRPDVERNGPLRVLFLYEPQPSGSPATATALDAAGYPSSTPAGFAPEVPGPVAPAAPSQSQNSTVAVIRAAAERLTAEGFGDFELSDASTGRLVPVPPGARQPLIAAIALHARGREVLYNGRTSAATALEFLVEADQSFERCRESGAGQLLEQLSNVGQLQLDICWAYALLGDSNCLTDAETRLVVAERMIRRQVDKNFLTLAEVEAEKGNTLPPEVVPSVRLWLLRGIALMCRGDPAARVDLERAALFLQALHVNEDSIAILMTFGASRVQAIAALRRNGGSADKAGDDLLAAAAQRDVASRERSQQRKLGQCANGSFVDVERLSQLTGMGIRNDLAIAALKQANNDVSAALDAVQTQPEDTLLNPGNQTKKAKKQPDAVDEKPVDEIALISLISLGFERAQAEAALRAVDGNIEEAIVHITATSSASTQEEVADSTVAAIAAGECNEDDDLAAAMKLSVELSTKTEDVVETLEKDESKTDEEELEIARAAEQQAEADAKAKADQERAAQEKAALDEAREVIERELGRCLRRGDIDDEVAGASLEEEEILVQQHLSSL